MRRPAAGSIANQESAKCLPVRSDDAIRFDLALDELEAISTAKTGARAELVDSTLLTGAVADQTVPLVPARDAVFGDGRRLRHDAAKNNESLFDLLATDRLVLKPALRLDAAIDLRLDDYQG